MTDDASPPSGPDLSDGLDLALLADGAMLLGHVGSEAVLLARQRRGSVRDRRILYPLWRPAQRRPPRRGYCPLPVASRLFRSAYRRTGTPSGAQPVPVGRLNGRAKRLCSRRREPTTIATPAPATSSSRSIVILGGGAAGNSAAETLRREGHAGRITMISADTSAPYDRPNCPRTTWPAVAPEEWLPLRSPEFYKEHNIDLRLGARAVAINRAARHLELEDGTRQRYDTLLWRQVPNPCASICPGSDLPHIHYLRSLADSRALIRGRRLPAAPW